MMTLIKYFKTRETIKVGSFLSCKIDGNLYVLYCNYKEEPLVVNLLLVNIRTGETKSRCVIKRWDFSDEKEVRMLLKNLFSVKEGCIREDDFLYWHKLSKQEAIGKFASMLLET